MNYQRFCPVCDGPFSRGEAVIRCDGCGVLYHPACWNRNDGCQTRAEHASRAVAIAYGVTAVAEEKAPPPTPGPAAPAPDRGPGPHRRIEPPYPAGFVAGPRAEPHADRPVAKPPLPSLYRGPWRWLRYWYVPAAALVAAAVAFGIVTLVDWIVGEPESQLEPAPRTTVISQTPEPTRAGGTPTAPGAAPTATAPAAAPGGGAFNAGQEVEVTGTGDCLNLRSAPSTGSPIIACLADGTTLTVVAGPENDGARNWWRVRTGGDEGWVAEEYLVAR